MPTLREWAYAGFTIDLIGATASHVCAGDPVGASMVPALFLIPLAVSYVLRPDRYLVANGSIGRRKLGAHEAPLSPP